MVCDKCKKNQATVHMAQIINGEKIEQHLCGECAGSASFGGQISFQDIFQGLLNLSSFTQTHKTDGNKSEEEKQYNCDSCGLSYEEFRQTGKLGCVHCYDTFKPNLDTTLKSMHGMNVHCGKIPKKSGSVLLLKREKDELKKKLALAIHKEEFEEAAKLRDKIRELEKGV